MALLVYRAAKTGGSHGQKYTVTLTDNERGQLLNLTMHGKVSARRLTPAHLLLQADAGLADEAIARPLHVGTATVEWTRKRFVEESCALALSMRLGPGGSATGWQARGLSHRPGVQYPARGTGVLDDAVARGSAGRSPGGYHPVD
jgi:hypothetical protein